MIAFIALVGWYLVLQPIGHGVESFGRGVASALDDITGNSQQAAQKAAALAAATKATSTFAGQVNAIIAANPAITFSVSTVTPLSSMQHYGSSDLFLAASTGKLITATDYLHHVETGQASLTQDIEGVSAEDLLQAMIVNSDDNAWVELNDYLTYPDLQSYGNSLGLTDYQAYPNKLTSNDIATVLNHLYNTNLLNAADRSLLLGYLQQANYRQYIVPAVPGDDTIYHKVGVYLGDVHDATIIAHGNQWLILVIFTNGSNDVGSPAPIMQTIAKDAIADFLPGT